MPEQVVVLMTAGSQQEATAIAHALQLRYTRNHRPTPDRWQ
jgi:hypothetical protein